VTASPRRSAQATAPSAQHLTASTMRASSTAAATAAPAAHQHTTSSIQLLPGHPTLLVFNSHPHSQTDCLKPFYTISHRASTDSRQV
jgi:hypothetical protein